MKRSTNTDSVLEQAALANLSDTSPSQDSLEISDEITPANFVTCLEAGVRCWEMAGQVLVQLRQQDPDIFKKLCAACSWLTADMLWAFHKMGEGKLFPQVLLMRKCPAEHELLQADYQTQKLLCTEPIDIVVAIKKDKPVIEKRWVREIGKETAALIFNHGVVRTLADQEKCFRDRTPKPSVTAVVRSREVTEPTAPTAPKKLVSLGCFTVPWTEGFPILRRHDGPAPVTAQAVICNMNKPGETVIEFKQWL